MRKILLFLVAACMLFGCKESLDKSKIRLTKGEKANQITFADQQTTTDNGFAFYADDVWFATITTTDATRAAGNNNVWWLKLYVGNTESYSGTAGNSTLWIELVPNYTNADRKAEIVLSCAGESITLTVTQKCVTQENEELTDPHPVEAIFLSKANLNLDKGASETITATVLPAEATTKSVSWSSSNQAVASVDPKTGKITAHALGSAIIYATSDAQPNITTTCTVSVMESWSPTGEGRFTYGFAPNPFDVFYAFYSNISQAGKSYFNVQFADDDLTIIPLGLQFYASGAHTKLPAGSYTFSESDGAGTFQHQKGVVNGQVYYCHSGTVVVAVEGDNYSINVNINTFSDPEWLYNPSTIKGNYTGRLRVQSRN